MRSEKHKVVDTLGNDRKRRASTSKNRMETTNMNIIPYEPPMRQAALDLALRA